MATRPRTVAGPRVRDVNTGIQDALLRRAVLGIRYENATERAIRARLKATHAAIADILRRSGLLDREKTGFGFIDHGKQQRFQQTLAAIAVQLGHFVTGAVTELRDDLKALVQVELRELPVAVQAVLAAHAPRTQQEAAADLDPADRTWELPLFRTVPAAQLTELLGTPLGGAFFQQSFADLAASLLASVRNTLLWGLATGQGIPPVARKVQGVLGNARWQAERIVRSEFGRVANQAALATYAQNEEVLDGVQWVGTLDEKTCLQCGVLDGRTWESMAAAPIPITDTHPNCRCKLLPIVKDAADLGLPPGSRASFTGQVPATLDYATWFEDQDAAFQREVLGPTRYRLYQGDRASLGDFATASGIRRVRDVLADFQEAVLAEDDDAAECRWITLKGGRHICIQPSHRHVTPPPLRPGQGIQTALPGVGGAAWQPTQETDQARQAWLEQERQQAIQDVDRLFESIKGTEVEVPGAGTWEELSEEQQSEIRDAWEQEHYDHYRDQAEKAWREGLDLSSDVQHDLDHDEDWQRTTLRNVLEDEGGLTAMQAEEAIDKIGRSDIVDALTQPSNLPDRLLDAEVVGAEIADALALRSGEMNLALRRAYEDEFASRMETAEQDLEVPDSVTDDAQEAVSEAFSNMDHDDLDRLARDFVGGPTSQVLDEPARWLIAVDTARGDTPQADVTAYAQTGAIGKVLMQKRAEEIWQTRYPGQTTPDFAAIGTSFWDDWKRDSFHEGTLGMHLAIVEELAANTRTQEFEAAARRGIEPAGVVGRATLDKQVYARALWETTQFLLAKSQTAEMDLYRTIVMKPEDVRKHAVKTTAWDPANPGKDLQKLPTLPLQQNPAQSFTFSNSVANHWDGVGSSPAGGDRVVIRAKVPATAIWSLPVYGKNIQHEREAVVLGTPWKKWDAWLTTAPPFSQVNLEWLLREDRTQWHLSVITQDGGPVTPGVPIIDLSDPAQTGGQHWLWHSRVRTTTQEGRQALVEFNPHHVPAGSPQGGQFTSGPGGGGTAPADPAAAARAGWTPKADTDQARQARLDALRREGIDKVEGLFKELEGTKVKGVERAWDALSDDEKQEIESDWVTEKSGEYYDEAKNEWLNDTGRPTVERELLDDAEWTTEAIREAITVSVTDPGLRERMIDRIDRLDEIDRTRLFNADLDLDQVLDRMGLEEFAHGDFALFRQVASEAWTDEIERRVAALEIPDSVSESAEEMAREAFQSLNQSDLDELAGGGTGDFTMGEPEEWNLSDPSEGARGYAQTQAIARTLVDARANQLWLERYGPSGSADTTQQDTWTPNFTEVGEEFWDAWKRDSYHSGTLGMHTALVEELAANTRRREIEKALKVGGTTEAEDKERVYARALWDTTQFLLSKAGVEEMNLYRTVILPADDVLRVEKQTGIKAGGGEAGYTKLPTLALQQNPAQSFTFDKGVANTWGGVGSSPSGGERVVLRAKVPPTAIWSLPVYGKNIQNEHEAVVLGTPWKAWDAWLSRAPDPHHVLIEWLLQEARVQWNLPVITQDGKVPRGDAVVIDLSDPAQTGGQHWLWHGRYDAPEKKKPSRVRQEAADDECTWRTIPGRGPICIRSGHGRHAEGEPMWRRDKGEDGGYVVRHGGETYRVYFDKDSASWRSLALLNKGGGTPVDFVGFNKAEVNAEIVQGHLKAKIERYSGTALKNSLGIARSEMPQIREQDYPEFLQFATAKGISVTREQVSASLLRPAQMSYNPAQAAQFTPAALKKPLVVSADDYVLDGTNRWVRLQQQDPHGLVDVVRLGQSAPEALALMKSFPKAGRKTIAEIGKTKAFATGARVKIVPTATSPTYTVRRRDKVGTVVWATDTNVKVKLGKQSGTFHPSELVAFHEAGDDCRWITYHGRRICITSGHGRHEPGPEGPTSGTKNWGATASAAEREQYARTLATKYGLDADMGGVDIRAGDGPGFAVGDMPFQQGGYYSPDTERVVLWADDSSQRELDLMMSHEGMHHRWHKFRTEADREHAAMQSYITSDPRREERVNGTTAREREVLVDPIGSDRLRPEMRERWPALYALREFQEGLLPNTSLPEYGKRVSDYAKSYWVAWEQGKMRTDQAVNETLAEMSRRDSFFTGPAYHLRWPTGAGRTKWENLWNAVNATFTRVSARGPLDG